MNNAPLPFKCKKCEWHYICLEGRNEYANCAICEAEIQREGLEAIEEAMDEDWRNTGFQS